MTATVHGDAAMRKGQDYWRAKLSGLRGSSGPPLDFPRPDAYAGASAEADFGLPADVQQSLLKLTGDSPFLLYVALLTALNVCLHKYAGGETVVVGRAASRLQTAYLFACGLSASLLGIVFFLLVNAFSKWMLSSWHESEMRSSEG